MGNCFSKTKSSGKNKRSDTNLQTPEVEYHKLPEITEECNTLKRSLESAHKEKEAAEEEVKLLCRRVQSLENVVRDLQDSAEHVYQLEKDRQTTLQQLHKKQAQLEELQHINSSIEAMHAQTVQSLNKLVAELDEKMRKEEEKRLELTREMERLQNEATQQERTAWKSTKQEQELAKRQEQQEMMFSTRAPQTGTENISSHAYVKFIEKEDDLEGTDITRKRIQRKSWHQHEQNRDQSLLLSWAQNGPIQVYIAKYNYNPFALSPNESPEAELPLAAGDYVLVIGEMDEDGFFDGELLDGTQGLVPSNFIQKLEEEEDLLEFKVSLLHSSYREFNDILHNPTNLRKSSSTLHSSPASFSSITNYNILGSKDINSLFEEEEFKPQDDMQVSIVPCPCNLSLDKQLTNILQISWRGPDPIPGLEIHMYQVFVDGQIKASVRGNERTKAVLEGINSCEIHRICVQCLSNRGKSQIAQCTLLVGENAYPVPSDLKVSHLSATSASLSWLPGNSNYQHSVVVDDKEIKVLKPGVFSYTLTGLTPETLYKVTVTAKSVSGILNKEKSLEWVKNASSSIEFYTNKAVDPLLHKAGDSTLQTGSAVIKGSSVSDLTPPSQALITNIMQDATSNILTTSTGFEPLETLDVVETRGPDSDEEMDETLKEYSQNEQVDALNESYSDGSYSQLSDIPEVEEDLISSNDSHLNKVGTDLTNHEVSPCQMENKYWKQKENTSGPRTDGMEIDNQKPQRFDQLAKPSFQAPYTETLQDSDIALVVKEEEKITSSDRNTPIEKTIKVNEISFDAQNKGSFQKLNNTDQRTITDSKLNAINKNIYDKSNDTQNILHDSTARPAINHLHNFNSHYSKNVVSRNSKNEQKIKQRPLSDSVLVSEYKKYLKRMSSSPLPAIHDDSDSSSISGENQATVKANSIRLFIALFDYDPATMSPNVGANEEELPFMEGQLLKVFGHKDADGFYKGEINGRMGYIPCNMVCEVKIDDPEIMERMLQDISETGQKSNVTNKISNEEQSIPSDVVDCAPRKMVALYDYDPKELSPNFDAELELSFKTGNIVTVYGIPDDDGFYIGEINSKQGLVPSNFLRPASSLDINPENSKLSTSRSCESLEEALRALEKKALTTNVSDRTDKLTPHTEAMSSNKQQQNASTIKSGDRSLANTHLANEEQPKKEGFFSKSKNIFFRRFAK